MFPKVQYGDFRKGLCLLDPYGLHLNWEVVRTAGGMKSIDLFLNFPVANIHRNVLWRNPEGVDPADIARMNAYWGDESWRQIAYTTETTLFGMQEKTDIRVVAEAFRLRLEKVAGFKNVPEPLPMRNAEGAVVYYLYFASQKKAAMNIISDIFVKYRDRRG